MIVSRQLSKLPTLLVTTLNARKEQHTMRQPSSMLQELSRVKET